MELTDEQKERIRRNKERALAIQRKRRSLELGELSQHIDVAVKSDRSDGEESSKKLRTSSLDDSDEEVELEDFEVGASEWVTKKEAMSKYCLPEGTLAVCKYTEKENPHQKGWKPMKLYSRAEIRRRARERFGGLEELKAERLRREEKRFSNDLEKTKNVFQSGCK
jgi:XPA protein C-terminus